jgi:hypothetical protein
VNKPLRILATHKSMKDFLWKKQICPVVVHAYIIELAGIFTRCA